MDIKLVNILTFMQIIYFAIADDIYDDQDVQEARMLSLLEMERTKFELGLSSNLKIREHGTFDYASPLNARSILFGDTLVPRDIEIYLRLLSSPVLQQRPYNMSFQSDYMLLKHLGLADDVVVLQETEPAFKIIANILKNEISLIRYIKDRLKPKQTWPTYIDNKAAYTNLWHHALNLFTVSIPSHTTGTDSTYTYYIDDEGNILKYKYILEFDYVKFQNLSMLLGYWSIDMILIKRNYIKYLESLLNDIDRSHYPIDFFDVVDVDIDESTCLFWEGNISWDDAILEESRRIARVTIRLLYRILFKMMESHGVNVLKFRRGRNNIYPTKFYSRTTSAIRSFLNHYTMNLKVYDTVTDTPIINDDVEELLYESVSKFSLYWNVKNDSLYNKNSLHDVSITPMNNSILELLKFEPNSFYNSLTNLTEEIDFKEVYEILLSLIQESTPAAKFIFTTNPEKSKIAYNTVDIVIEQYKALPYSLGKLLRARCNCLMAFLYMFGIPDKKGQLKFPKGWPRNDKRAVKLLIDGMGSKCGLCNSILGFLAAIGYPPISNNMHAWEMKRNNEETTVYQLLDSNIFDEPVLDSDHADEERGFDLPLLSYLSGSYKHDEISSLAYGYYIYSGISNPSRTCEYSPNSSINRTPTAVGSTCLDAIPYIIDAAKYAMKNRQSDQIQEASDEYKSKKYAEFVKKLANMGDADGLRMLGDFYYAGHEEGGIRRDYQQALRYWSSAAESGDTSSALAVAHHHISMMNGYDEHAYQAERYLRMIINSSASNSSTARFYMARYGLGQPVDPVMAARWLRESADRGDVNSQVLMGHAFAGILNDVTPAEGKNIFMSFYYYRRAASNGNIVGLFNSAVFTLHGYDLGYETPLDRCKAAYRLFSKVGRMGTLPTTIKSLSKRFKQYNDKVGHALTSMFLSELGDPNAHQDASNYFKSNNELCYISKDEITHKVTYMDNLNEDGEVIDNPCYFYYGRRSGYDEDGGSPLLLAETLLSGTPWEPTEALKWAKESRDRNDTKGCYMYATMLEAGLGTPKDCNAAFDLFNKLLHSNTRSERILGFLCIIRTKIISILKSPHLFYSFLVYLLYDKHIVPIIDQEDYIPCDFPLFQQNGIIVSGLGMITIAYVILVLFVSLIYIKTMT